MGIVKPLAGSLFAVGIALTAGCADSPLTPPLDVEASHARAGGGKGGGKGASAAQLTTRDDPDDNAWGDGAGAYVDGAEKVELRFDMADFHFEPASSRRGPRAVYLSFADAVSGSDPFDGEVQRLGNLSGFRVLTALPTIPCGQPTTSPARFLWQDDANAPLYRLALGIPDDGGHEVDITREDGTAGDGLSTWTIESSGNGALWEVSASPDSLHGTFSMPFHFVVTGTDEGC